MLIASCLGLRVRSIVPLPLFFSRMPLSYVIIFNVPDDFPHLRWIPATTHVLPDEMPKILMFPQRVWPLPCDNNLAASNDPGVIDSQEKWPRFPRQYLGNGRGGGMA